MTTFKILILCLALIAIVGFMYFVLPRLTRGNIQYAKWIRLIIFTFIATYLAIDFYSKAKYGFLVILLLGSIAFVFAILNNKKQS